MNVAFNTAAMTMVAAHAQVTQAARQIANPSADENGVIDALVAIKQAEKVHAAAATIVRTSADMQGELVDILA